MSKIHFRRMPRSFIAGFASGAVCVLLLVLALVAAGPKEQPTSHMQDGADVFASMRGWEARWTIGNAANAPVEHGIFLGANDGLIAFKEDDQSHQVRIYSSSHLRKAVLEPRVEPGNKE